MLLYYLPKMKKDLKNFIVLSEVDSTNNYANHLISTESAKNGTVVLAQFQKRGRGQRGNSWESDKGRNLLASVILYPVFLPATLQFYISKAASLAIAFWLRNKTGHVSIKWPNDIYSGNKKIAGILIETAIKGNILSSAVVGIGLNLNQDVFNSALPNPVSLRMLTGTDWEIITSAEEIHALFMEFYGKLESGALKEIDDAYYSLLYRRNEWALYREGDIRKEARIIGVGADGQLMLEDRSGNVTGYFFKEIEFVI